MKSMEENESLLFDFYRKAQIPTSETDPVKKMAQGGSSCGWISITVSARQSTIFGSHLPTKLTHKDQIINWLPVRSRIHFQIYTCARGTSLFPIFCSFSFFLQKTSKQITDFFTLKTTFELLKRETVNKITESAGPKKFQWSSSWTLDSRQEFSL